MNEPKVVKQYLDGEPFSEEMPFRSLYFGEGVFETFRCKSGLPVCLDKHYARMEKGASVLKIPMPDRKYITALAEKALTDAGMQDAQVKICLLSAGDGLFYKTADRSRILISVKPYVSCPGETRLCISTIKRNSASPVSRIKSLNYLDNVLARREAEGEGYDEALILNEHCSIAEASASNIFWLKKDRLYTPSEDTGLLPGVTRALVMELSAELGIQILEGEYVLEDIYDSETVFLTNSLTGARVVSCIGSHGLPAGSSRFELIISRLRAELRWQ